MQKNVIALIPQIELDVIEAYLNNGPQEEFSEYFLQMGIPEDACVGNLEIAVARILLNPIQASLPQWALVRENDEVVLSRKEITRHRDATRLKLNPKLICCINWADSAPGFSWPESYHITYIPGFERFIVTSSRDGEDLYGCSDHAIGHGPASEGELGVAKRVIKKFWSDQAQSSDQERWAYLFNEGLIDEETAEQWASEVWIPLKFEAEDDDNE